MLAFTSSTMEDIYEHVTVNLRGHLEHVSQCAASTHSGVEPGWGQDKNPAGSEQAANRAPNQRRQEDPLCWVPGHSLETGTKTPFYHCPRRHTTIKQASTLVSGVRWCFWCPDKMDISQLVFGRSRLGDVVPEQVFALR